MAKTSKEPSLYQATTGLTRGRDGRQFQPGETVKEGDFPPAVIAHWLETGVLVAKDKDNGGQE
jgi:hypothetical protein